MMNRGQFSEIRKRILWIKLTIGTNQQLEWAEKLVADFGFTEDQAVGAVNMVMREIQRVLDRI